MRVALVSMPFVSALRPSIQLGLLKAIAEGAGFAAETRHFNLDLAAELGLELYERLCDHRGPLIGEWLFSKAAFGAEAPDPDHHFLRAFLGRYEHIFGDGASSRAGLVRLRDEVVPRYLDRLVASEDWSRFSVVGFTSTFQQQVASLALARAIKRRSPATRIVMGGANLDATMGPAHLEATPWVDFVVVGEGDDAFPELLAALDAGGDGVGIANVAAHQGGRVVVGELRPPKVALDALPTPDYDEFFSRASALGVLPDAELPGVHIPIESARGCWWGEKHHCTFCGLNGATMKYRAKSAARVKQELAELARRYRSFHFEAVDNILATDYFATLLPELARERTSYAMFFEVKANMGRDQVRLLREAGIHAVQPGIESLSTHVLELMRKGTTALQNVNFLRWCRHYGVHANWNLLWGFPAETAEDYQRQLALARTLFHLQPPVGAFRVWLERFSPLYEARAGEAHAERSYSFVYPSSYRLDEIAYFFEPPGAEADDGPYLPTRELVEAWKAAWQRPQAPSLTYWSSPGLVQIEDRRGPTPRRFAFVDGEAEAYLVASDKPIGRAALLRALEAGAYPLSAEALDAALARFQSFDLVAQDDGRVLALALPAYVGAEGRAEPARARPALPVVT